MQVHWHEGLFLLPHHLQRIQRSIIESSSSERRLSWAYPYGLIDARLSTDDLENMRLRFDRLHAIMPSGQEVLFPQDAELPAMDIKQAFRIARSIHRLPRCAALVCRTRQLREPRAEQPTHEQRFSTVSRKRKWPMRTREKT